MSQTPRTLLRDMEARNAAIRRYAFAHDKFAELEQRYRSTDPEEAEMWHEMALVALRACRNEMDDPTPRTW